MKIGMFYSVGEFARLKGRAAELRNFGRPLLNVFTKFMDNSNRIHKLIRLGLHFSMLMEDILDRNVSEFVLNQTDHREFLESCYNFLAAQTALGNHYHPKGLLRLHCTIKSHYMLHIALYSRYMNPRLVWTYMGEDYMQNIKQIVSASQRGTPPPLIANMAVNKYLDGLSFALVGDKCWA